MTTENPTATTLRLTAADADLVRAQLLLDYTAVGETLSNSNFDDPDDVLAVRDELRTMEARLDAIGWRPGEITQTVELTMPGAVARRLLSQGLQSAADRLVDVIRFEAPSPEPDTLTKLRDRSTLLIQWVDLVETSGVPFVTEATTTAGEDL